MSKVDETKKLPELPKEIIPEIGQRWSPRSFASTPVEPEKLRLVLEAASWAASSFNEQPWRFLVGIHGKGALWDKLSEVMVPFNQSWAKTAPVLMLICGKKSFSGNGSPNRVYQYDAGAAASTACLEATRLGLYTHQMAGIDQEKAAETLSIPEDFEPLAMMALGYLGELESLSEDLQRGETAPRSRMPLAEFVFTEGWEQGEL